MVRKIKKISSRYKQPVRRISNSAHAVERGRDPLLVGRERCERDPLAREDIQKQPPGESLLVVPGLSRKVAGHHALDGNPLTARYVSRVRPQPDDIPPAKLSPAPPKSVSSNAEEQSADGPQVRASGWTRREYRPDDLLNAVEAAAYLGISVKTLANHRSVGPIPGKPVLHFIKAHGRILYAFRDIVAFLEAGRRASTSEPGAEQ